MPIQALDYWIHYQQAKSTANSLESKGKDELKRLVYGNKDAGREVVKHIARTVGKNANFDQLVTQSHSFKHFHDQVTAFLKNTSQ